MPDGTVFIVYCFVMRIIDALGSSGCETAAIVTIATEFPDNVAAMMVTQNRFWSCVQVNKNLLLPLSQFAVGGNNCKE